MKKIIYTAIVTALVAGSAYAYTKCMFCNGTGWRGNMQCQTCHGTGGI